MFLFDEDLSVGTLLGIKFPGNLNGCLEGEGSFSIYLFHQEKVSMIIFFDFNNREKYKEYLELFLSRIGGLKKHD